MEPSQFNRLIKVLERIASALEKQNKPITVHVKQDGEKPNLIDAYSVQRLKADHNIIVAPRATWDDDYIDNHGNRKPLRDFRDETEHP